MREGVPAEAILLEEQAQNTGDNFVLGRACVAVPPPEGAASVSAIFNVRTSGPTPAASCSASE
jgi:uncharacterized SAM-binding protein YcdF (DUF218 family)